VLWSVVKCCGVLEFCGFWNVLECCWVVLWSDGEFNGVLGSVLECYGVLWSVVNCCFMLWCCGVLWSIVEC